MAFLETRPRTRLPAMLLGFALALLFVGLLLTQPALAGG